MRIIMNGTTITGSVSEVLATLTHLGFKASDTTAEVTANDTAKSVTMPVVTEIAVTDPEDMEKVAESIVSAMRTRGLLTPADDAVATPKLTRDGVIQQAIADVKDLLSENYSMGDVVDFVGETLWFASKGVYGVTDEVLFTINADKRTVIALVRGIMSKRELSKGRAKCAPGDVFNEHIGKAIALRRALGLEVPVEYFTVEARDRDDLAVGDVVRGDYSGSYYEITKFSANPHLKTFTGKFVNGGYPSKIGYLSEDLVTLINDSARHIAPDLEVSRIIRH